MQAQHRFGRGADDRQMGCLRCDEGEGGIAGERRERGNLLGRQQDQHLIGAQVQGDDTLRSAGAHQKQVHHKDTKA